MKYVIGILLIISILLIGRSAFAFDKVNYRAHNSVEVASGIKFNAADHEIKKVVVLEDFFIRVYIWEGLNDTGANMVVQRVFETRSDGTKQYHVNLVMRTEYEDPKVFLPSLIHEAVHIAVGYVKYKYGDTCTVEVLHEERLANTVQEIIGQIIY